MKKRIYILIYFLLQIIFLQAQQNGLYSNFLQHQVVYNPAYAAAAAGKQFNINYRNQWTGFEGAPKTIAVSGYGNLRKQPDMAIGGLVFSEKAGLIDYTAFYGIYAYHLKFNKTAGINFGLGVGAVQYSVRTFNARPYDRDDAMLASGVLNGIAFDANAGLYFYSKNFFLGFSNQHMSAGKIRWSNTQGELTPHFYLYSGYNIAFDKKKTFVLQPAMLVRFNSPVPYQMEANLKLTYKDVVWIGGNYRQKATAGGSAGVLIDKQFSVSYCYDYTLSGIGAYAGSTHEIFLAYQIPLLKKKSKSEQIQDADEEELNKVESKKATLKGKKETEENSTPPKKD